MGVSKSLLLGLSPCILLWTLRRPSLLLFAVRFSQWWRPLSQSRPLNRPLSAQPFPQSHLILILIPAHLRYLTLPATSFISHLTPHAISSISRHPETIVPYSYGRRRESPSLCINTSLASERPVLLCVIPRQRLL